MTLFATVGYHRTDNTMIAQAAALTRGAMLYHFPTREALVDAVIAHIDAARARLFEAAAVHPPHVDAAEHAIDAYWSLLRETPFIAFSELEAAARTDPMLKAQLAQAQAAFDHAQVGERFNALAQAGADPRFQASRDLGRFLLEGLAKGAMTYDETARQERLLQIVKRAVRALNRKGGTQDLWPESV
ncbi:MAG: TetR family transcriptional regulator [Phenylobacterium zucineum]|nr:MAG: TetR family transcriptional regulator [Phenylobacterium zucineum]